MDCFGTYFTHACPKLWCNSCSKCYGMRNALLRYILHTWFQSCDESNARACPTRVQSATEFCRQVAWFESNARDHKALKPWTEHVLFRTTKYYSSTTPYHKVLLQYFSVLQSTTLALYSILPSNYSSTIRTTKNYSSTFPYHKVLQHYSSTTPYHKVLVQYYSVLQSTTPYHKVLLQYYSIPQSTTPVLLRTTKYYSTTAPYHSVLLQYHSVLQSTTPVLLRTTK